MLGWMSKSRGNFHLEAYAVLLMELSQMHANQRPQALLHFLSFVCMDDCQKIAGLFPLPCMCAPMLKPKNKKKLQSSHNHPHIQIIQKEDRDERNILFAAYISYKQLNETISFQLRFCQICDRRKLNTVHSPEEVEQRTTPRDENEGIQCFTKRIVMETLP